MKLFLLLLLVFLLLTACATPPGEPGNYDVVPRDGQIITPGPTFAYGGYVFTLRNSEFEPTVDHATVVPIPTTIKVCELRVQGLAHVLRNEHRSDAAVLATIPAGGYLAGLEFYYVGTVEWAKVRYGTLTGWVLVTSNILYDPLGPCLDVPVVLTTPIPTAQPTATAQPTFTPVGTLYVCSAGGVLNVRSGPSTSYTVLGTLSGNQQALVKTFQNGWTQISYRGGTAYVYSLYTVFCTGGVIQ